MKKFARFKTPEEIAYQCLNPPQKGMLPAPPVPLDMKLYFNKGLDTIVVGDLVDRRYGYVIYNTFNGTFFGVTPWIGGPWPVATEFHSSDTRWERERWFKALLNFFYVKK